jgi:hypothetical protein
MNSVTNDISSMQIVLLPDNLWERTFVEVSDESSGRQCTIAIATSGTNAAFEDIGRENRNLEIHSS